MRMKMFFAIAQNAGPLARASNSQGGVPANPFPLVALRATKGDRAQKAAERLLKHMRLETPHPTWADRPRPFPYTRGAQEVREAEERRGEEEGKEATEEREERQQRSGEELEQILEQIRETQTEITRRLEKSEEREKQIEERQKEMLEQMGEIALMVRTVLKHICKHPPPSQELQTPNPRKELAVKAFSQMKAAVQKEFELKALGRTSRDLRVEMDLASEEEEKE